MKRILRLEKIFIKQYLKQLMEYKIDFIIGVLGVFLTQGLNILFLGVIFSKIPNLHGWTLSQIAFIYGFSLIPKGIDHLFFDNLWNVGQRLVWKGEFDKYMTRPINPLFHVLVETFQVDAFGELLVGILLLASTSGSIHWTLLKVALFIFSIPFATLIYTSMKIATSSMAFWSKQAGSIIYIFYMLNDFAKYPVSIYNNAVRFIISFIIPFAFTAFYPARFFLSGENVLFNIGGLIIISLVLFVIALVIWSKGVSVYESAGS
ncbi:ABC-type multidrug transport system permease component [Lactococcus lactis subsp. lactis]|uniref:ABC transporter permease n=1 Tax=Lactococcus lactis TaxID=1358 RepID=UPI00071E346F|nr:ABC transporter permease [Lactococcus lactis]KST91461.1 ABC-type multidrug transport system permease component [Lactococcus lactis subsp. lactis]